LGPKSCVICSQNDIKIVYKGKDRLYKLPGEFSIGKCENCGVYCTLPSLSENEIASYYPDNYHVYRKAIDDEPNLIKKVDRQTAMYRRWKQISKRRKFPGRILDIGCATGNFLNEMKKRGWECWGVEPNTNAANYAKDKFDLHVHNGYLLGIQYPSSYFDVVTLWDVLEHTQDPSRVLKEIQRILKPEGFIFLSLPNADSYENYLFGRNWCGWDVPRHYITFTQASIQMYLSKMGYHDIKIGSFYGHHGVFMISLRFWLDDVKLSKTIKNIIFTIMNSVITRAVTLPLFLFLDIINRSSIMGVSAMNPKVNP